MDKQVILNNIGNSLFKTFTHAIGHYFGLLHNVDNEQIINNITNMHINNKQYSQNNNYEIIIDPLDKNTYIKLNDNLYNPSFSNFMDFTNDNYLTYFTKNQ